jgi:glycosyltransferase involved in cell wall biosynthesis
VSRRILVITYHFPPSTVAASFRPLRLAKYLPELDYEMWVLSATPGGYPADRIDHELAKEVPGCVHVTRVPNPNPLLWYEARNARRASGRKASPEAYCSEAHNRKSPIANLKSQMAELAKFPDSDAPWAAASLVPALGLMMRHGIDLIYTSAPPFGAHVLGLALKRITGKPWIAHYGNPWTANPSISWNRAALKRSCDRLDRSIVHSADAVLVLDDVLADCIHDLGRGDGVYVHPNGFDPAHFAPTDPPGGRFTVTYAGSLYNMHDPRVIYEALSLIERDSPSARADMRIVFAGPPESDPLRDGAPPDIEFTGPLAHADLAKALNDSHLLLDFLTASSGQKFTVSCKLYEYMAARRPILAVTPPGPLADDVRRLSLGRVAPCDDPGAVARALMEFYSDHRDGALRVPNNPGIDAYSAPNQVRAFARVADEVCSGGKRRRSGGRSK